MDGFSKVYYNELMVRSLCFVVRFLVGVVIVWCFAFSTAAFATNDSIVDEIDFTVPVSCTLTGVGMDTHNAEIHNGQSDSSIGETTFKAYCNDINGFGIYAVGFTDDVEGKNVLTDSSLDASNDIVTGTATGPVGNVDTSNWAMKLSMVSDPTPTYPITIQNSFDSFHAVPSYYTLVAKRTTATDVGTNAEGATFKSTYQAYVSNSQHAGTYTGKVKYTLVHPASSYAATYTITYNANTEDTVTDLPAEQHNSSMTGVAVLSSQKPVREGYGFYGWCTTVPSGPNCSGTTYRAGTEYPLTQNNANEITLYAIWGTYSELDSGLNVNAKMKSLAAGTSVAYGDESDDIKAVRMASSLPAGFVPSDANTISTSEIPTYIYFDNTNDAGIMYVYTTAEKVRLKTAASMFSKNTALVDISGVADWDMQNVKSIALTFSGATSLSNISPLANWDTSSATLLVSLFEGATNLSDISPLANWDTSKVFMMTSLFEGATSLSDISPLANWDTSSLKSAGSMFKNATNLSSVSPLVNWNTSSVTGMGSMFYGASSLTNIDGLAKWDTSKVKGMSYMFYGATSLSNIDGLADWDTSSVNNMAGMFWNTPYLIDFSPLANWDTPSVENLEGFIGLWNMGKVDNSFIDLSPLAHFDVSKTTTMKAMFQNINIPSLEPLKDWDVGSVEDFSYMFNYASTVVDNLDDLEDWNVSSAKDVSFMFGHLPSLRDVSAVNDWDITSVTATAGDATEENNKFYRMFTWSPVYPEFSKRAGTWNSLGTFIPSE